MSDLYGPDPVPYTSEDTGDYWDGKNNPRLPVFSLQGTLTEIANLCELVIRGKVSMQDARTRRLTHRLIHRLNDEAEKMERVLRRLSLEGRIEEDAPRLVSPEPGKEGAL